MYRTQWAGLQDVKPASGEYNTGEMGFQILPVVQDGKVTRSITRHDLLRAVLGIGPTIEE